MAEAKTCPFCGCQSVAVQPGSTFRWVFAECMECGASTGEERVQTSGSGTPAEWAADAEARAMAEWNRRTEAAPTPAASRAATPDDMREAYEAHVLKVTGRKPLTWAEAADQYDLKIELRQNYVNTADEFGWTCWQAALALQEAAQPASPAPLTDEQIDDLILSIDHKGRATDDMSFLRDLARAAAALASPQVAPEGRPVFWVRQHPDGTLTSEVLSDARIEPVRRNSGGWWPLFLGAAPVQVAPASPQDALVLEGYFLWDGDDPEGYAERMFCSAEGGDPAHKPGQSDFRKHVWVSKKVYSIAAPMPTPAAADDARDAAKWRCLRDKLPWSLSPSCGYTRLFVQFSLTVGESTTAKAKLDALADEAVRVLSTPAAKPANPAEESKA